MRCEIFLLAERLLVRQEGISSVKQLLNQPLRTQQKLRRPNTIRLNILRMNESVKSTFMSSAP